MLFCFNLSSPSYFPSCFRLYTPFVYLLVTIPPCFPLPSPDSPSCLLRPGSGGKVRQRWMICRTKCPTCSILKELHHQPTSQWSVRYDWCKWQVHTVFPFLLGTKHSSLIVSDKDWTGCKSEMWLYWKKILKFKRWAFTELQWQNLISLFGWYNIIIKEHITVHRKFFVGIFLSWTPPSAKLCHIWTFWVLSLCALFCKTWNVCNYFEKSMCSLKKLQLQSIQSDRLKAFM